MTVFGCQPCGCDCPPACSFTNANCFEITFSGFASAVDPGYACTACNRINEHSFVLRRGVVPVLRARATAVRPSGEGQDAVFQVTLTQNGDDDFYTVTAITLISGGSNYLAGTYIQFEYGIILGGSFQGGYGFARCDRHPFAWITGIGRAQPTVVASLACGAAFSVSLNQTTDENDEIAWEVDSVTVTAAGTSCVDNSALTFTTPNGEELVAAEAVAITRREEPQFEISIDGTQVFGTIGLTEADGGWEVSGITSLSGSMAFAEGDVIAFAAAPDTVITASPSATVDSVDEFGNATVSVISPGLAYRDTGELESVEVTEPGLYYRGGAIQSVALVEGGEIISSLAEEACFYRGDTCLSCPVDYGQNPSALLTFATSGSQITATLSVSFGGAPQLVGTVVGIDPDEESITFSIFSTEQICSEVGSVTVTAVSCDTEPTSPCEPMPQQISLTVLGLAAGGEAQGVATATYLEHELAANAECGTTGAASCFVPTTPEGGGGSVSPGEDQTVILDLIQDTCDQYTYFGQGLGRWSHGTAENAVPVCSTETFQVEISKTPCSILVSASREELPSTENDLCPPSDTCPGGQAAAVLAVGDTDDGAITSIVVESAGSCYAWRTFSYSEPEGVVSATSAIASGAEFSLVWEEDEDDPGHWYVADITVADGGTGYIDEDALDLVLDEGSCGSGFAGYVITTRLEPEFTLDLPSPGSGAEISFELAEVAEECLLQYRVTAFVIEPGDNYTDLAVVTVTGEGEQTPASLRLNVTRTIPEVTATVGTAELEVVLAEFDDNEDRPAWRVASVSVVSGGAGGIEDGALVTFSVNADETVVPPLATVGVDEAGVVTSVSISAAGEMYNNTGPIESVEVLDGGLYCGPDEDTPPVVTAVLPEGDDGEIGLQLAFGLRLPCTKYFEFSSVTVDEAGDGYKDRDEITVTPADGTINQPAVLRVRVTRQEPEVTATVGNATLAVTLDESTDEFGDAVFSVASVSVTDGGSGIAQDSVVSFVLDEGSVNLAPQATVDVVDGVVTNVVVLFPGELVDDIGPIDSVEIEQAGRYWTTDGSVECVVVTGGGQYYKATPDGVEVTEPVISIFTACGSGATAEAVVDADPESETFGGIAEVTVTNGGEGYYPLGNAWIATVSSGALLGHLTQQPSPEFDSPGFYPARMAGFSGTDLDFVNHESLTNRTSVLCPNDVLSREYRMFKRYQNGASGLVDADGDPCGKWIAVGGGDVYVRRFGNEDITVTLAPE